MAQITIEYMIMIPLLILQIFLFPLAATMIINHWSDSRQELELQDVASQLGSTIQQLYYTVNNVGGVMKVNLGIPSQIEGYMYTVTLSSMPNSGTSYKIMNVTLSSQSIVSSTVVTLGSNINWQDPIIFNSTTSNLCLIANNTANYITLTLGGS